MNEFGHVPTEDSAPAWQAVLDTREGHIVLGEILRNAQVLQVVPDDPGAIAVHNFGITILERIADVNRLAASVLAQALAEPLAQPEADREYPLE